MSLMLLWLVLWSGLSLCHSPQVLGGLTPNLPIFSPDGTTVAFLGDVELHREAVGLCAFPDGGKPLVLRRELQVYLVPANGGTPRLLATVSFSHDLYVSATLFGWSRQELTLCVSGARANEAYRRSCYTVDATSGAVALLPDTEIARVDRQFWGQCTFFPHNPSQWLKYDHEERTIGLYTGGAKQIDLVRRSMFTSGYPPTTLVRVIVSKEALNRLQSEVEGHAT